MGWKLEIHSDLTPDPQTGKIICSKQRIEEIIRAAKMADEAGLDVFGMVEHHRLGSVHTGSRLISHFSGHKAN